MKRLRVGKAGVDYLMRQTPRPLRSCLDYRGDESLTQDARTVKVAVALLGIRRDQGEADGRRCKTPEKFTGVFRERARRLGVLEIASNGAKNPHIRLTISYTPEYLSNALHLVHRL